MKVPHSVHIKCMMGLPNNKIVGPPYKMYHIIHHTFMMVHNNIHIRSMRAPHIRSTRAPHIIYVMGRLLFMLILLTSLSDLRNFMIVFLHKGNHSLISQGAKIHHTV